MLLFLIKFILFKVYIYDNGFFFKDFIDLIVVCSIDIISRKNFNIMVELLWVYIILKVIIL